MEARLITWNTDQDELAILAELLQKEIRSYAALQTMPSVIAMTAAEATRYDLMCNMYNNIIRKL